MSLEKYMEEAFKEAEQAIMNLEVPVGCVFVYKDIIIARGANEVNATKNATRHAEMVCIDQAQNYCQQHSLCPNSVFSQLIVVVTVEPCIMCLAALHQLGVKQIYFGCENDRFGGKTVFPGSKYLLEEMHLEGGHNSERAMQLLKSFYQQENPSTVDLKSKKKSMN